MNVAAFRPRIVCPANKSMCVAVESKRMSIAKAVDTEIDDKSAKSIMVQDKGNHEASLIEANPTGSRRVCDIIKQ